MDAARPVISGYWLGKVTPAPPGETKESWCEPLDACP